ncbi:hypothetical protein DPMN_180203 [Dreissena polymorpha]|uniref:PRELI/MSF1 domain-containing protein n=1 Tax=Dreissena polymorpha TaxID=45954 RepID=A0A9D4EFK4_DREPO|nr:hypothetical protein DPMN_180203 [Dreissena polymorpha]
MLVTFICSLLTCCSAPWDLVVRAQFRKYPNEFNNAVEGVDVVERRVDKTGTLYSHRLLSTRWGLPGWATKVVSFGCVKIKVTVSKIGK